MKQQKMVKLITLLDITPRQISRHVLLKDSSTGAIKQRIAAGWGQNTGNHLVWEKMEHGAW